MQRTVATSPLLQHRIKEVVPARMDAMRKAIRSHDFDSFADLTMADSNNFHACALDTSPPIFYMNDTSRAIVQLIEELNRASVEAGQGKRVAYTYDAGPNAVLYAEEADMKMVLALIRHYFPNADFDDTVSAALCCARGVHLSDCHARAQFNLLGAGENASHRGAQPPAGLPALPATFNQAVVPVQEPGAVRRLIHTRVGDGPRTLHVSGEQSVGRPEESLLDEAGMPIRLQRAKKNVV